MTTVPEFTHEDGTVERVVAGGIRHQELLDARADHEPDERDEQDQDELEG